jgi:formate hydrogenlyase subunit 3/multisubunit Na+/H+ antiporter MnhD subunit
LGVILTSSVLDVVYFFPVVKTAFFEKPGKEAAEGGIGLTNKEKERPLILFMVIPLAITAVFSIFFFFFPGTFYILDLAELAINNLFH